jgi:hypothetical protein
MNAKTLLIAGSGLLLTAIGFLLPDHYPAPATTPAPVPNKKRERPAKHHEEDITPKNSDPETDGEAANL